jgi:hypothetical protein
MISGNAALERFTGFAAGETRFLAPVEQAKPGFFFG